VLFGHGLGVIRGAVTRVLRVHGFAVETVSDGHDARDRLQEGGIDAFVVDVALPGVLGYELVSVARDAGVDTVILVASVYRKTSYKRRPSKLYGADDYVEIHHLGDHLPTKLRANLTPADHDEAVGAAESVRTYDLLRDEGDHRIDDATPSRVAEILVADFVLYHGDIIAGESQVEGIRDVLLSKLADVGTLYRSLRPSDDADPGPLVDAAFAHLWSRVRSG
jgi:DNA-binding response OmpR family regulator